MPLITYKAVMTKEGDGITALEERLEADCCSQFTARFGEYGTFRLCRVTGGVRAYFSADRTPTVVAFCPFCGSKIDIRERQRVRIITVEEEVK